MMSLVIIFSDLLILKASMLKVFASQVKLDKSPPGVGILRANNPSPYTVWCNNYFALMDKVIECRYDVVLLADFDIRLMKSLRHLCSPFNFNTTSFISHFNR